MDPHNLHKKIIESSAKNKKTLNLLIESLRLKKKQVYENETLKYQRYRQQYEQLLKFNKESQEQNYRLKKQLALIDIEIEQLSYRNKLSRSRIRDHNDEISILKDQTQDIDKQKKRQAEIAKACEEARKEKIELQAEIGQIEEDFERKRKTYYQSQEEYHQKRIKKQYLVKLHRQNHQKSQEKIDQLQNQLRTLQQQLKILSQDRQRQQKTKRNNRNIEWINQIKEMVQIHRQSYDRD